MGCGVVDKGKEREMGILGVNMDEGGGEEEKEEEKGKENSLKTT